MMRKMSSLTGEKIPETMEEMIRRMEAGEDPEKLEEEYDSARPIEIKLEHPNGGWFTPEQINADA